MWMLLGIASAFFLGIYDVNKKRALRGNAVLPVLFLSTVAGLVTVSPALITSRMFPEAIARTCFYVSPLEPISHLHIFIKAMIVSSSWILSYFAIKHLPISIVSPIRATSPLWTLLGAVLIFGERLNAAQLAGIVVIVSSFFYFSKLGSKEGINFKQNRWIYFIFSATILGTVSALYDKKLIQGYGYDSITVQAWFSFYLVLILGSVVVFFWFPTRRSSTPFRWNWSIAAVGVLLILADFLYFRALEDDSALIALLTALRRTSAIVSFSIGAILFGEVNKRKKAFALAGVLAGVFLILFSRHILAFLA